MTVYRRIAAPAARPLVRRLNELIDRRVAKRLAERDRRDDAQAPAGPALREELDRLREQVRGVELLLGRDGRRTKRTPSAAQLDSLARRVTDLTGDPGGRRIVVQAYRTLVDVENRGVGRIAGGTPNILGKLAATPLLTPPGGGAILEIGTLFGLFAGGLARQMTRAGLPCHLTIVDPLAQVQLQPGRESRRDPSGTPVTEEVVRANLRYAGVPTDQYRLLRGYSGDPELRAKLAGETFAAIVVDGDHSEEGVASDLAWVEEIAAPGAVVVLDDYGDEDWPGVRAATEKHLAGGSRLTMLGAISTSAFLRAD